MKVGAGGTAPYNRRMNPLPPDPLDTQIVSVLRGAFPGVEAVYQRQDGSMPDSAAA